MSIEISIPNELGSQRVDELREAEMDAGRRLMAQGVIHRIWRLPGTTNNIGIWCSSDASELHNHLGSLPLFPYMHVRVTPLALHPLEAQ